MLSDQNYSQIVYVYEENKSEVLDLSRPYQFPDIGRDLNGPGQAAIITSCLGYDSVSLNLILLLFFGRYLFRHSFFSLPVLRRWGGDFPLSCPFSDISYSKAMASFNSKICPNGPAHLDNWNTNMSLAPLRFWYINHSTTKKPLIFFRNDADLNCDRRLYRGTWWAPATCGQTLWCQRSQ